MHHNSDGSFFVRGPCFDQCRCLRLGPRRDHLPAPRSFNACLGSHFLANHTRHVEDGGSLSIDERVFQCCSVLEDTVCGASPLSPASMQQACAGPGKNGPGGIAQQIKSFAPATNKIHHTAAVAQQFPDSVRYPKHCTGMCLHSGPLATRRLYAELLAVFASIPQMYGKPANLPFEDVILALTVDRGAASRERFFFAMVIASSRHG